MIYVTFYICNIINNIYIIGNIFMMAADDLSHNISNNLNSPNYNKKLLLILLQFSFVFCNLTNIVHFILLKHLTQIMSENIEDLVKKGPSIQFAADKLRISRQTFYRLMHQYQENAADKMNPHVKAYFDQLRDGRFETVEDAKKYLENAHTIIIAEEESRKELIDEQYKILMSDRHKLFSEREKLSSEEYNTRMSEINARKRKLDEESGRGLRSKGFNRYSYTGIPTWIGEEMRSCVVGSYGSLAIIIDCEYWELRDYMVEILMKIDDQFYPIVRLEPEGDSKVFEIGDLPRGVDYCYRVVKSHESSLKYSENRDLPTFDF